ncbi:hypothetical protein NEOKW01_1427 [Nematocida sp. AWRm80]|nr:hypothetical protein NEOKW01_1427 [Nematocida sp. AWRm80]
MYVSNISNKNVFGEIKEGLASGSNRRIVESIHLLSKSRLSLKQKSVLFPIIVSLILNDNLEIKSISYSYILRLIEIDSTLLLLVVNTVLQELKANMDVNCPLASLKVSMAIDFISKVDDKEFLNHFYDKIESGYSSNIEIIRKSSILAAPKVFALFNETTLGPLLKGLQENSPIILGSTIQSIIAIEQITPGTFKRSDFVLALTKLCLFRQEIEETQEKFAYLFTNLCRVLRPILEPEILSDLLPHLQYMPVHCIRELIYALKPLTQSHSTTTTTNSTFNKIESTQEASSNSNELRHLDRSTLLEEESSTNTSLQSSIGHTLLTPSLGEKILFGLLAYLGTEYKKLALETILLLLQQVKVHVVTTPFLINGADQQKEKILKLKILKEIGCSDSISEIRTFIKDSHCTYHSLIFLIQLNLLQEEDILAGFKYNPSSTLRALYISHPIPIKFSNAITNSLSNLSNVSEKEAFLFLSGYYLSTITDEIKRIRRIKNTAGGILYGKKEEREKSEEHLEEYMYLLLNFHSRNILSKDNCIKEANLSFSDEPFLLNKFTHLIQLNDQSHLKDLISYKRISYRLMDDKSI